MLDRISSIITTSLDVRRRHFAEHANEVERAAVMIADAFRVGGKLLLFGKNHQ